jgi:hypothetical protein
MTAPNNSYRVETDVCARTPGCSAVEAAGCQQRPVSMESTHIQQFSVPLNEILSTRISAPGSRTRLTRKGSLATEHPFSICVIG